MKAATVAGALMLGAGAVSAGSLQPSFKSAVDLVQVDVSVMNGISPVPGLTVDNFEISDNGVPQTIEGLFVETVPLDITLLLDTSASVHGERLAHLVDAARGLVQTLAPDDRTALMTFAEPVRLVVGMSRERTPVLDALGALSTAGYTSLNDALFVALQARQPDRSTRRAVLLLFSDGDDTSSWLSDAQVTDTVRRSGTLLHIVELLPQGAAGARPSATPFLGALAVAGGGRQWSATSSRELRRLFAEVMTEIRSRYLLTYTPRGVARDGWHDVAITLKGVRGTVIARPGYFVQ